MQAPSTPDPLKQITGAATSAAPVTPPARHGILARLEPYLYLLPAFLVFTVFLAIPAFGSVILSLTSWNGVSWDTATFIGLENYIDAITDRRFQIAFWHNIVLIPYFVLLPLLLGLIPAAVVHQLKLRGARWLQAGLFLPYIMPGVLIGVVWAWILNPIFGPVNKILKNMGFSPPTWLGDFTWALPTVGMIGAWAAYGFCYVIFIAGLQKIPSELYEAVRLDGANTFQEFMTVTVPGLRREIAVVLSVNLINALRAFDIIKATTDGGPGDQTQVMALYMINTAFGANRAGYGTAIAVLLALITLIGSMLVLRFMGEDDA